MKIPTTPVLLASLSLASSSLAAPTREKPDCDSPTIGEKSPLLGQDAWGPALQLKGRGVAGQGRPWGAFPVQKRQETPTVAPPSSPLPPASPAPSFASSSTPLLGATDAPTDSASAAAEGLLTPVTGTLKGVVGGATGALNGLLGNTPLGPVVGTVGDTANGLLDKVGEIGNGGLGLGPILKPAKDIAGGLPIVGPIAGGLVDTVGGLNLAQQPINGLPIAGPLAGSVIDRLGGLNIGQQPSAAPTPNVSPQLDTFGQTAYPTAQMVEETIVGRLEDGRLVTNTGRVIGLASSTGSNAGSLVSALPIQPPAGLGGSMPVAAPSFGQVTGNIPRAELGKLIASLPPGLGQVLQPIGGAEKYLQIGQRLIPLGAADVGQLAQLGLDRLPVTPVGGGFGYPSINYLQDGAAPDMAAGEGDDAEDSKEVKANPVTTWMNGNNATMVGGDGYDNSTAPDNSTLPLTSDNSTMTGSTMPLAIKSQIPPAQFDVEPLELAPPSMNSATNQTIAGKPHSIIKGDVDPWYEVDIDGGDTFKRIAAEMSGQEKNYYSGGERDPDTEHDIDSDEEPMMEGHGPEGLAGTGINIGAGVGEPIFHGDKGRVGWQEITSTPSSIAGEWRSASASGTATPTMSSAHGGPTHASGNDAGTYAWSEDWGDWVSAGLGDTDLHVGWDDASGFASASASVSVSVSAPVPSSTHMWPHSSAGLS